MKIYKYGQAKIYQFWKSLIMTAVYHEEPQEAIFCTASGGTSKNLEFKGKFLEYLRQLS